MILQVVSSRQIMAKLDDDDDDDDDEDDEDDDVICGFLPGQLHCCTPLTTGVVFRRGLYIPMDALYATLSPSVLRVSELSSPGIRTPFRSLKISGYTLED